MCLIIFSLKGKPIAYICSIKTSMKKAVCILLLLLSMKSFSQKAGDTLHYYIVLYTVGPAWDTTKAYHEQVDFKEHSAYLSQLRKVKLIVLGARYSDTGMIVIRAKDEAKAREIVNADKAIRSNLFKAQVFAFEAFYKGCIDETD